MSSSINTSSRKRVAIVGSGCAGIATLWALNRTYHDVYLYEAADRLGGHTNTVQWTKGKYTTAVDTGFIVLNTAECPNFSSFLDKLGVETEPAEMSFAVSRDQGLFEWASSGLRTLFSQKRNIVSPRMWRMVFDIVRFNQFALDLLLEEREGLVNGGMNDTQNQTETIGEYLDREGYSVTFKNDYLIPIMASVWSIGPEKCSLDFPAAALIRLLWNYHLLSPVPSRSQWLTLKDGSKSYIDAVMKGFPPNHLFTNTPVRSLSNDDDGRVILHLENGKTETFDHVVLATHGDQALSIINQSATEEERSILSSFQTSYNEAVLHSDVSHMPTRRKAWSGWNCRTMASQSKGGAGIERASLTCNMNVLQDIPRETFGDVLVTINPLHRPRKDLIQGRYYYTHPLYTADTARAQQRLRDIQNTRGVSYAGAWTNFGLHEDAFTSGLSVARDHLAAKLPIDFRDMSQTRRKTPALGLADYFLRFIILIIQVFVVQVTNELMRAGKRKAKPLLNGAKHKLNGKAA